MLMPKPTASSTLRCWRCSVGILLWKQCEEKRFWRTRVGGRNRMAEHRQGAPHHLSPPHSPHL